MTSVSFPAPVSGALSPTQQAEADAAKAQAAPPPPAQTTPPATPERPQWLPEKFKSPEDLATAYKALESKLGAKPNETPAPVTPKEGDANPKPEGGTPESPKPDPTAAEAAKIIGADDFKAFSDEFATTGQLSPETFAKLEAKGIPKATVEAFIAGQQARLQGIYAVAGGSEQSYQEMAQWAGENLSPEEIASFNAATTNPDIGVTKLAVQALYARFAQDRPPKNITQARQSGAPQGPAKFRSNAEIQAAMSDPRYAVDEAYRAEVASRL